MERIVQLKDSLGDRTTKSITSSIDSQCNLIIRQNHYQHQSNRKIRSRQGFTHEVLSKIRHVVDKKRFASSRIATSNTKLKTTRGHYSSNMIHSFNGTCTQPVLHREPWSTLIYIAYSHILNNSTPGVSRLNFIFISFVHVN